MKKTIKIAIIGAGSNYTPELIRGIINQSAKELPIGQITMMDIDAKRLDIMAGLAERMLKKSDRAIRICAERDLKKAVSGVDFVISQIRVGGVDARVLDEKIPLKYDTLGQETTGAGGMFKALRTIPQMLQVAQAMHENSPEAILLNYTNPSGIITEAIVKHSDANIIGLCSGMPAMQAQLKKDLEPFFPNVSSLCVGLNHLGFMHKIYSNTTEITAEAIQKMHDLHDGEEDNGCLSIDKLNRVTNAIPIGYANYYFHRKKKVSGCQTAEKTRGEQIRDIQKDIFDEAGDPTCCTYPKALAKRGGGGYSDVTFDCLKAIWNDTSAQLACSVQNRGAVKGIDDDAVVEVVCNIDRRGATPLAVGEIPLAFRGVVQAVKAYESLTVDAAMKQDKNLVYQALLNHPLVGDIDDIEPLVDELLTAHGLEYS